MASLFSDGNVSATQFTRVLNLAVRLPWPVQARAWDAPQVPAGRVTALGGRFQAGPRDGGGFRVRAEFPARASS